MKKLIFILFFGVALSSYAKPVPKMTLYEYMHLDSSGKKAVEQYVQQEYGNLVAVTFILQLGFAFETAKTTCMNLDTMSNFYKKKYEKECKDMNRKLKRMTLGDLFKEMEKNL